MVIQEIEQKQLTTRKSPLTLEQKDARRIAREDSQQAQIGELQVQSAGDRMKVIQAIDGNPNSAWNQLTYEEKQYAMLRIVNKLPKWKAATQAFNSRTMAHASNKARLVEKKPEMQLAIKEVYNAAGVTAEKLAGTVAEALDATKTYVDKDEGLLESEAPDWSTRLAAVKQGHEMRGESGNVAKAGSNVTIKVDARGNEELEDAVAEALLNKHRKKAEVIDVEPID